MSTDKEALKPRSFVAEMRFVRTVKKITLDALSEMLAQRGISLDNSALSRMETGQREPRLREAFAIAGLLGISLDGYVYGEPQAPSTEELRSEIVSDLEELLKKWGQG